MATIPLTNIINPEQDALKTEINGIYDHRGFNAHVTSFGELTTAERIDDVAVKFQYNNPTYETIESITGTGVVSNADSKAKVSTGAGIGTAKIESRNIVRYRPGHEAFATFTAVFSTPDANTKQRAGIMCDAEGDGMWIGYDGTQFGVSLQKGGVDTFVPQSSWNGDQLLVGNHVLDPTKMNIYRISYGWLGIAPVVFEVSADNGRHWTVIHTFDLRNDQADTTLANPMLPLAISVESTAAPAAPVTVETSSWNGGTVGGGDIQTSSADRYFSIKGGSKAIPAATLTNVLSVSNPLTYQGKTNRVQSQLLFISFTTDGTKPVEFEVYEGATVGGTPNFTPVDSVNSQLSFDVDGDTVSGGTFHFAFDANKVDSNNLDVQNYGLYLAPGTTVTFAAKSASATNVSISIRERSFF